MPEALAHSLLLASAVPPSAEVPSLEIWPLLMGLAGGLALFLFGMEQLADALKAIAGERMRSILGRLTTNRVMGALTGAFVTAVI